MSPSLRIRQLAADDSACDLVARWRHEAFFADMGMAFEETLEAQRRWLVQLSDYEAALLAEIEGNPAGCCLFVREEIDAKHDLTPWLASLYVAPEFRKQGAGAALVRAIEMHARDVGCSVLHLYTVNAEPFYAGLGWITQERFDWHGEPMILMTRDL